MSSNHVHPHTHPHHTHPHEHSHQGGAIDRRTLLMSGAFGLGAVLLASCRTGSAESTGDTIATSNSAATDAVSDSTALDSTATTDATTVTTVADATTASDGVLPGFDAFAETVQAFTSGDVWLIESNGMPQHQMMVGITSWQQQVAVPQAYTGTNAWQFPQTPQLSDNPISGRTGLFRGAIALAVNGVPIFNALNNRGDDAFLAGELDEFGGHAGRADDYHYHVAPLHLEEIVGSATPIAYALDGFAIYGSVEPDGAPIEALDEYNGHVGADGTYHYHGTTTYPYINGGLRGVVTVSDQVDPQPTTPAFRPAGEPLAGATISAFDDLGDGAYRLEYTIDSQVGSLEYTVSDTSIVFEFTSPDGATTTETYSR